MKKITRLPELDFARSVAIILALGWHFYTPTGIFFIDLIQAPGHAIGWVGVDLFFVLSGYLIGGLIFKEVLETGAFNSKRFLIRRAFKIWPVLYLYIGLLVLTGRYPPMEIVPQTLLHLQNYWTTPLSHLWSLAVEEHFYLIFAFFAATTRLAKGDAGKVPFALMVVIVLAPVLRMVFLWMGMSFHDIQIQTQFRVDALAFGVLLAYIGAFREDLFEKIISKKSVLFLCVFVGVSVMVFIKNNQELVSVVGYTITMLTSGCFLLLLRGGKLFNEPNIVVRFFAWIGSYSYAIYVFQFVMFRVLERVWSVVMKQEMPPIASLMIKYGGALLLAVLITKLVERPMINLRNRLFPT